MGDYRHAVLLPLITSFALLALATGVMLRRTAPVGHRLLPWGLAVGLVFLAANQLLVRGIGVGTWDADGQFYPYYVLVADHARAARFVQWDPWSSGGLPLLGDPQVGAFSPVNVGLGLLTGGTSAGFRTYWLLLWSLGGLGILLLGRTLGTPAWGAPAVALGFLFCGVYTGNAEHTSWIVAFSFLPLTVWRVEAALRTGSLRLAAQAGAIWGLSALSGYPGIVMMTGCLAALWAVGRRLFGWPGPDGEAPERPAPGTGLVVATVSLLLLVGLVVLSPTYVAFFAEGAAASSRVGTLPRAVALSNSLEPGALATFASPFLPAIKVFRQFTPGYTAGVLWPATDPSMVSIYAGSIVPVLALYAVLVRPRDRWRWWIAGLGLLGLACAMGETLPFRGWLYDWLYPTRFFRHAAMFRLYFVFALCVLALLGTRDLAAALRTASASGRRRLAVSAVAVAAAATAAFLPYAGGEWSRGMPGSAVLLGWAQFAWAWLGVVAIAALACRLPGARVERVAPVLLLALAASDALLTSVLSIPTTLRVGEATARWQALDARHRSGLDLTARGLLRERSACEPESVGRCRRNDQLITKEPVLNAYSTDKNPFHLGMIDHPVLESAATGPERIWFVDEVAQTPATEEAFAAFRRRAEDLGAPPVVVHPERGAGDELARLATLPAATRVHTEVVRYQPGEMAFRVRASREGWLLVTDRWARGWQAAVDGRPARLLRGNFIFRAVQLPPGEHLVRFLYRSAGYPWLLVASWGTLLAVVLASMGRTARSVG